MVSKLMLLTATQIRVCLTGKGFSVKVFDSTVFVDGFVTFVLSDNDETMGYYNGIAPVFTHSSQDFRFVRLR